MDLQVDICAHRDRVASLGVCLDCQRSESVLRQVQGTWIRGRYLRTFWPSRVFAILHLHQPGTGEKTETSGFLIEPHDAPAIPTPSNLNKFLPDHKADPPSALSDARSSVTSGWPGEVFRNASKTSLALRRPLGPRLVRYLASATPYLAERGERK